MSNSTQQKCTPCRGDEPPLSQEEIDSKLRELNSDWEVNTTNDIPVLQKTFKFKNYSKAVAFANRVAQAADDQDHHPKLVIEWGRVEVHWWTHKIKGLHQNDFIMAAQTDSLL